MDSVISWLKKPFVIIGGIIAILLIYIKLLRSSKAKLEVQSMESDEKQKDAVLAQQQQDLKDKLASDLKPIEDAKKQNLTDQQLTDEINKL
jgi:biopolymer transport protein ExbB/TolQ